MTSKVRITVVVENTAQGMGILAEHGLAYWIQWEGSNVLLDTGQGAVLEHNASRLGVPLDKIDRIVLSHGHYDHTGGLPRALRDSSPVSLFLHPAALEAKYARNRHGTPRAIGMPKPAQEAIHEKSARIIPTESPTPVLKGLTATGPVPRITDFEDTGGSFYLDPACAKADPLRDDQSLFFETPEGIVVLLGCAHSGVINTLHYIRELTGNKPIRAVIGGMHLVSAPLPRILRTVDEFRRLGVRLLAPAHCTGIPATVAMWTAFPTNCAACHAGSVFEFESC